MKKVMRQLKVIVTCAMWYTSACNLPDPTLPETETPIPSPTLAPTPNPGPDIDGDGYGRNEECNDNYHLTYPGADEVCDGDDNNCNGTVDEIDIDGDGYQSAECGGDDCDDGSADLNPGAVESCNGMDENCNKQIDEGVKNVYYEDSDSDGYGNPKSTTEACVVPAGYVSNALDCRDGNPSVHPGVSEICDAIDQDCDGDTDEGLPTQTYYPDVDQDGYGSTKYAGLTTCDTSLEGYSTTRDDCNDASAAIHPDAEEVCNHIDDDCDGQIDAADQGGVTGYVTFYPDGDGDGYGVMGETTSGCEAPDGYASSLGDCNDENASINPAAQEACNGLDDDCDDQADEGLPSGVFFLDHDADGFGEDPVMLCATLEDVGAAGVSRDAFDCHDQNALIHPGAADQTGDGVDSDCGGRDKADPHVGLSSTSAPSIQQALDSADDGVTVFVGAGSYQAVRISMLGMAIRLQSVRGAEATHLDAGGKGSVLEFSMGESVDSVVSGFTLTHGLASEGGGAHLVSSSPTIRQCVIEGNEAVYGGGLFLSSAHPTLEDVNIVNNMANEEGGGGFFRASSPSLTDVLISGNAAGGQGGGLYLRQSSAKLTRLQVESNVAVLGGGLSLSSSQPTLDTVLIGLNEASQGGGLYADGSSGTLDNCRIEGNVASAEGGGLYLTASSPRLSFVRVVANQAGTWGGGIYAASSLTLQYCLLGENSARSGGGAYLVSASPDFVQVVVTANRADEEGGGLYLIGEATSPSIERSIVSSNEKYNVYRHPEYHGSPRLVTSVLWNPEGVPSTNLPYLDRSILEEDPQFLAPRDDGVSPEVHLEPGSPAVGWGGGEWTDVDGSPGDVGIYGGTDGDGWDLDGDYYPDYFWPGGPDDAPQGFSAVAYDLNDEDSDGH